MQSFWCVSLWTWCFPSCKPQSSIRIGGIRLRKKSDSQHQETSNALIVFHSHRAYFQIPNRPQVFSMVKSVNVQVAKKNLEQKIRPSLSSQQPPTCHYPPHDVQPYQIKLSKLAGIDRPTEDLQPSTTMTSISHVFLLTDFLTSIRVAAKQALKKTIL
jgi:hypothetical protein